MTSIPCNRLNRQALRPLFLLSVFSFALHAQVPLISFQSELSALTTADPIVEQIFPVGTAATLRVRVTADFAVTTQGALVLGGERQTYLSLDGRDHGSVADSEAAMDATDWILSVEMTHEKGDLR